MTNNEIKNFVIGSVTSVNISHTDVSVDRKNSRIIVTKQLNDSQKTHIKDGLEATSGIGSWQVF
jgi:ribosome-binding factor A